MVKKIQRTSPMSHDTLMQKVAVISHSYVIREVWKYC